MRKIILNCIKFRLNFILILFFWHSTTFGQVTLLSASGDGGFEASTSSFSANGWTQVVPGTARRWRVGTAAGSSAGSKAAYMGAAANHNGLNNAEIHHFYRDIVIPSNVTATLNYKYLQPTIDDGFDFFNIFATTTSNTPTLNVFPSTGYTMLFENTSTTYASFTTMPSIDLSAYAGTTLRLVFTFESDGATPNADPALDEISIVYCNNITKYTVTGGGFICSIGGSPLSIGLSGSQTSVNYQLKRNGTNVGTAIAGTGSALSFPTQTAAGTYTVEATGTNFCTTVMTGSAKIITSSAPTSATIVKGVSKKRCNSIVDSLTWSGGAIIENSEISSETLNLGIPDNNVSGTSSSINVSGIGTSAKIDSIIVSFNLSHEYLQDAEILLRAPNNKIIALAADQGSSSAGSYASCSITSNSSAAVLSTTASTISGTYRANATASGSLKGSFGTNLTSTFSDLFTTINGTWKIEIFDDEGLDTGYLVDWKLKICYKDTQSIWSPTTGLYENLAGTIPYTGSNLKKVYAKPSALTKYYVTSTNGACTQIDSIIDSTKAAGDLVTLAPASVAGAVTQCTDGGWTYYGSTSDPDKLIFAIDKTGASGLTGETVSISIDGTNFSNSSSNGANQEHKSIFMKRSWDVTAPTFSGSVKVRFFFDPTDSSDVVAARNADSATTKAGNPTTLLVNTPFTWFKSKNMSYSSWRSTNVVGNKFTMGTYDILTPTGYGSQNGIHYVEFDNIMSFSGGTGGAGFGPSGGGGVGLPVTWAGFSGKALEQGNELVWKTASEQNSDYFQVEYSYDGNEFILIPDQIKAAGNSAEEKSYQFIHSEFSSYTYYRIRQVDLDGAIDYSKKIVIKRTPISSFKVDVFPVPLEDNNIVNISVKSIDRSKLNIQLTDITGKLILENTLTPTSDAVKVDFDLSPLTPGIYFIEVKNGQGKEIIKISK